MSSKVPTYDEAYVWAWLPGETAPVVAGRLYARDGLVSFNYGRSFRELRGAIPLYLPELPLKAGELPLLPGLTMPGCIRDAAPDAWGRRVILNRRFGVKGDDIAQLDLSELTFLLESGSDRIGALDFQSSPTHYEPRALANATLEELVQSAERVEKGIPLTPELDQALHHGSSIGGARPKALIEDGAVKHVLLGAITDDVESFLEPTGKLVQHVVGDISGYADVARADRILVFLLLSAQVDAGNFDHVCIETKHCYSLLS